MQLLLKILIIAYALNIFIVLHIINKSLLNIRMDKYINNFFYRKCILFRENANNFKEIYKIYPD